MLRCKGCRKSFETLPIHKYKVCSAACLKKVTAKPTDLNYSMMTVKQKGKYNPILVQNKGQSHSIHQNKPFKVKINRPTNPTSYWALKNGNYVQV